MSIFKIILIEFLELLADLTGHLKRMNLTQISVTKNNSMLSWI